MLCSVIVSVVMLRFLCRAAAATGVCTMSARHACTLSGANIVLDDPHRSTILLLEGTSMRFSFRGCVFEGVAFSLASCVYLDRP